MAYAAFSKVDPRLLAQDLGADKSAVITAAGQAFSDIAEGWGEIRKAENDADMKNEKKLNEIGENIVLEQERLRKWTEESGKNAAAFTPLPGFTVKDNQIVYENQAELMALSLKGRDRRRDARNKKRAQRGKDSLEQKGKENKYDSEGNIIDDEGNILKSIKTERDITAYEPSEFEIMANNEFDNDYDTSVNIPTAAETKANGTLSQKIDGVNANIIESTKTLSPENNPVLASYVNAINGPEGNRPKELYNANTGGWDLVWKGSDGKLQRISKEELVSKGTNAFGTPVEDVGVRNVSVEALGSSFEKVEYRTPDQWANSRSKAIEYLTDNMDAYLGTYGIKKNENGVFVDKDGIEIVDENGDGNLSGEELYVHFDDVLSKLNPVYAASKKQGPPVTPGDQDSQNAQLVVTNLRNELNQSVRTQDASAFLGKTIGGAVVGDDAYFREGTSTLVIPQPDDEDGNPVDDVVVDFSNPAVEQRYLRDEISLLPTADQKGTTQHLFGGTGQSFQQGFTVDGDADLTINLPNGNIRRGMQVPEGVADGTHVIERNGVAYDITVADGTISSFKEQVSEDTPLYSDDTTVWNNVTINTKAKGKVLNIPSHLQFEVGKTSKGDGGAAQLFSPDEAGKLEDIFIYSEQNPDKQIRRQLEIYPEYKWAYAYYQKTGRINPKLVGAGVTEELYNQEIANVGPGDDGVGGLNLTLTKK